MAFGDRVYQTNARDAAFGDFEDGKESILVVLPTGTGKTILAAMMIREFFEHTGRRTLFLAQRETLVTQAYAKFTAFGLDASVEMAGQNDATSQILFGVSQVVVATVQSMQGARLDRFDQDEFGLIIVDETHHIESAQHKRVLAHFRDRKLCGITATPKPSLGKVFQKKSFDYPLSTAINGDGGEDPGGWLVPPVRYKSCVSVDLKGLRTTGGDFNIGDLEERLFPKLNEIADAIHAQIGTRQTIVFTPDVGIAQALSLLLTADKYGRTCEYVAGTGGKFGMPFAERKDKLDRFDRAEYQVVVCNELLIEGYDCTQIKCVVICRPSPKKMRHRYCQMVGRGLRPCPESGFEDCLVLDLDWEADDDARDLTMLVDLFNDDSRTEEVMEIARDLERAKATGEKIDPVEIMEEAEEVVRVRLKLQVRVDSRVVEVKTIKCDPGGIAKMLDVNFKRKYDMDTRGNNPASDAQIATLRKLGIDRPEGVSKWGASKMIKKLMDRRDQGLGSVSQVKALVEKGVNPELARTMSGESAQQSLNEMARAKAILATTQRDLF